MRARHVRAKTIGRAGPRPRPAAFAQVAPKAEAPEDAEPIDGAAPPDRLDRAPRAKGGFIKGAIRHPGAFKAQAQHAGMSTTAFAEKHKHDSGKTGSRARLALTLNKLRPK